MNPASENQQQRTGLERPKNGSSKNEMLYFDKKKLESEDSSFMELMTGFEPVTSSLPRMRSTD